MYPSQENPEHRSHLSDQYNLKKKLRMPNFLKDSLASKNKPVAKSAISGKRSSFFEKIAEKMIETNRSVRGIFTKFSIPE